MIKVLEEMHVPIDCIAGTSMGALIGGGYAAGMPAARARELHQWASTGTLSSAASAADRSNPSSRSAGLKIAAGSDSSLGVQQWPARDACRARRHAVPSTTCCRTYVAQARTRCRFRPASDSVSRGRARTWSTGKMVVLKEGDLATAMRASMAIPGAFAPVVLNRLHPDRRWPGQEHSRRCRPRDLCGRRHRREPGRAADSPGEAEFRPRS